MNTVSAPKIIPQSSVDKAFELLELMTTRPVHWGVTELTRELGLTKSNVHRLLQTLCAQGYVQHWPQEGKYSTTLKLWELGERVLQSFDVRSIAQPHMAQLAAQVHETIHLSVLDGLDVVYINRIESENALRAHIRIGNRAPAHCVATGKAMLAHLPQTQRERWRHHLSAPTPLSIQDFDVLQTDLALARERGYAVTRGEWRPGVLGVAAPIFSVQRQVIAAIGLSLLDLNQALEQYHPIGCAVRECAQRISRDCGAGAMRG